jgi:hypothetical protein
MIDASSDDLDEVGIDGKEIRVLAGPHDEVSSQ